jgi:hypothetical protein
MPQPDTKQQPGDPIVTVSPKDLVVFLTYPDGSSVQFKMPRPRGIEQMSADQAEQWAKRAAYRLAQVASEDLR